MSSSHMQVTVDIYNLSKEISNSNIMQIRHLRIENQLLNTALLVYDLKICQRQGEASFTERDKEGFVQEIYS